METVQGVRHSDNADSGGPDCPECASMGPGIICGVSCIDDWGDPTIDNNRFH